MLEEEILKIINQHPRQALESISFFLVELAGIKGTDPRDPSDLGILHDQGGEMVERLDNGYGRGASDTLGVLSDLKGEINQRSDDPDRPDEFANVSEILQ